MEMLQRSLDALQHEVHSHFIRYIFNSFSRNTPLG
jgi:hypothetical protein